MIKVMHEKQETAAMPDTRPCLQQEQGQISHTRCWNSAHALSSAVHRVHGKGSSFITNMAGNCLKCPTPPVTAVRVILSLVT